MMSTKYIRSAIAIITCAIILTGSNFCADMATAEPVAQAVSSQNVTTDLSPLSVVKSPQTYLNKKVTMKAKFDKFSTLGLDYKPAFKSSDKYISFLVKRDDTVYDIPLSEMKLFMQRDMAEKFIDLKTNDEIRITGTVFSDALGDAWIDVENITVIKKAPESNGVK